MKELQINVGDSVKKKIKLSSEVTWGRPVTEIKYGFLMTRQELSKRFQLTEWR